MIRRVVIRNYRKFRALNVDLLPGTNVLVGSNDSGKSTLIEAVNLALTGRVNGKLLAQELSPYYINLEATGEYVQALQANPKAIPPTVIVEVYLDDAGEAEILRGTNNLLGEDACGIRIQAKLSPDFEEEYRSFVADPSSIRLVPTEYYRVDWLGFSGNSVTARSIPATASVVDPASVRLQSGVDYHMQQIIRTYLSAKDRVELTRQYRSLREAFSEKEAVKGINKKLEGSSESLTQRSLSLAIDISQRHAWESGLIAHLDDLPFPFVSKGEQSALKTILAVGKKAEGAQIVLIEEPEAHLSFAHLRALMKRIEAQCEGKQVIVATHSTFVLNKLGLENMILFGEDGAHTRITDVPESTVDYFKKLAGFDTLRLVLAKGAILVEGPSDELIVQRGYWDVRGNLPIDDGIDVISVGLSHKRFLDLAVRLKRRVWVVTDNDGKSAEQVSKRFGDYTGYGFISIHTGSDPSLRTLEPQLAAANDLATLNAALGASHLSKELAVEAMLEDKTGSALAIFESPTTIKMPEYLANVIDAK
ncbi:ATP-dependent nuclease [Stenotrophomonas maltophilia]|uniref:ATP-dependent nuclease n=1 Tax=Stenotrophomonas maltophilia TaxID=40324 RepID=UPI000D7DF272|nr:AAA family ATPase [Stenotrophomonas maltophilia]AWT17058.1 ATP-dependent endonuclease [Stenotrophomonas maltophilia]MBA0284564.1 ATP-dependent endonuclease [Stenotrophomonas maltophilia]MBA0324740.1 ATP-dependent endonuclease [Stenotrophomonas maltophilia]HDS1653938.1 AAA family ATPase [Stenotrophomonas maltophilia]